MDPFTQGVVGATFAQLHGKSNQLAKIAAIGVVGGMAADLDVFIRSSEDPLLALEYHRHFTHSLIFIPIGALFCTVLLYPMVAKWWKMSFRQIYLPAVIGYATHALLDTCTSYGTQLFWPFSNYRASIDIISVVDPLFTFPVLAFIILAIFKQTKKYVLVGLLWGFAYLLLGFVQQQRAEALGWQLAAERGHRPEYMEAVWKTIYEHERNFYVDAVRPGVTENKIWPGESIAKLDVTRDFPWLDPASRQAKDIARFRWFSDGFVSVYPAGSNRIADIRYSLLPNEIDPLWGIQLSPNAGPEQHVSYSVTRDDSRNATKKLWGMIAGDNN